MPTNATSTTYCNFSNQHVYHLPPLLFQHTAQTNPVYLPSIKAQRRQKCRTAQPCSQTFPSLLTRPKSSTRHHEPHHTYPQVNQSQTHFQSHLQPPSPPQNPESQRPNAPISDRTPQSNLPPLPQSPTPSSQHAPSRHASAKNDQAISVHHTYP